MSEFAKAVPGYLLQWILTTDWKLTTRVVEEDGTFGPWTAPEPISDIGGKTLTGGFLTSAKKYFPGQDIYLIRFKSGGVDYNLQPANVFLKSPKHPINPIVPKMIDQNYFHALENADQLRKFILSFLFIVQVCVLCFHSLLFFL